MRRAIGWFLFAAVLLVAAPHAATAQGPSGMFSGVGLLDYQRVPSFKPGDYVRYHVTSTNSAGTAEDYELTLLIAGEELFWGDPCFWVETWTQAGDYSPAATATLISYSIFGDTLADDRLQRYSRRIIFDSNDQGIPLARVTRVPSSTWKQRPKPREEVNIVTDSLGTDTVETLRGLIPARRVVIQSGLGMQSSEGDTSSYTEKREIHTRKVAFQIPLTHFASEQIDRTTQKRSWLAGRSEQGALTRVTEHSDTRVQLVDYGSGLASRIVPAAITPGGTQVWPPRVPLSAAERTAALQLAARRVARR